MPFHFERWTARFRGPAFVERVGRRIDAFERGPRTTKDSYFSLSRDYEVVARYYEHRNRFDAARRVTLTHGSHPLLPDDERADVYVLAGLRALRGRRFIEAAEFLELACTADVPGRQPPFYAILERRLRAPD